MAMHRKQGVLCKQLIRQTPESTRYQLNLHFYYSSQGELYLKLKESARALNYYRKALKIIGQLSVQCPDDAQYKTYVAWRELDVGNVLVELKREEEALDYYTRANLSFIELSARHPLIESLIDGIAVSSSKLGMLHLIQDKYSLAGSYFNTQLVYPDN